ncbi:LamG domain-containing protein [Verrucomicrobiales bacterium]|nr:LamG domain-containing protein [Verrucomicrobiales bacterium]
MRLVKGTVITPPSGGPTERLEAVTNTSLLTCHLPYIADGSSSAHTITVNGNTSTKPFSPYDYLEYDSTDHGGSIFVDNLSSSTDDVSCTLGSTIGTGDFSISGWFYPPEVHTSGNKRIWTIGGNNNANGLSLLFNTSGQIRLDFPSNGTSFGGSGSSIADRWTHFCVRRVSGTATLHLNGVQKWTASNSINLSATNLVVGRDTSGPFGTFGYISDFKISTSSLEGTTVPTTPASSTGALVHIKGTDASIIDKSQGSNLKLIGSTTGSTDQVRTGNWANTKTMKFDRAVGDYITIPNDDSIFSKDYTIEFWMYPTQDTNLAMPFSKGVGLQVYHQSGNIAAAMSASNSGSYFYNGNFGSITTNAWSHISLVRDSSANTYKFYINGTLEDTLNSSSNIDAGSADWIIAAYSTTGGYYFAGYIQDLRVTEGLARYTATDETSNIPSAPLEG